MDTTTLSSDPPKTRLYEFRFHMKTGAVQEQFLDCDQMVEFPRVNDLYLGRKTNFIYAALFEENCVTPKMIGFVKYEVVVDSSANNSKTQVKATTVLYGAGRFGGKLWWFF
jgi:carotenoid cleavage dioxygenase-like enzyme